jgi:hypothetical protein
MNLTLSTNTNSLEGNTSFDKKLKLNRTYKFNSNNSLPFPVCNEFNKSLITGISEQSEASSQHSTPGIKKKNSRLKERIGINKPISKINQESIDKIVDDKIKVFEALENLLLNDNDNTDNTDIDDTNNNDRQNSDIDNSDNNSIIINKKRKKSLSVPKLDFSNIFNNYNRRPLNIQEVKYVSDFLLDNSDDSVNDSDEDINNRKRKKKYKYKKNKSKNKIK